MTIWLPQVDGSKGPIYLAIVDSLARDVAEGLLEPGAKLPTQRELSERMGVALTTVTRAYGEAERRGLVSGEVGRGTFVAGRARRRRTGPEDPIDLRTNSLFPYSHAGEITARMAELTSRSDYETLLHYQSSGGTVYQREVGADFVSRDDWKLDADDVLLTCGVQHAIAVTLATLAGPKDVVLTEKYTYGGVRSLAAHQHLRLVGVDTDTEGLLPDALSDAIEKHDPAALYLMSTIQNPTSSTMSARRRAEIAEVLDRSGIPLVEDDSYGFLAPENEPLSVRVENSFYLAGLSKSVAAGLRTAFLVADPRMIDRLGAAVLATVWMTPPPLAAISIDLIEHGIAERVIEWKRLESRRRNQAARGILDGLSFTSHEASHHLWLEIPDPWCAYDVVTAARMRGMLISSPDEFVPDRSPAPHAVRVSLGAAADVAELEASLRKLVEIVSEPPEPTTAAL